MLTAFFDIQACGSNEGRVFGRRSAKAKSTGGKPRAPRAPAPSPEPHDAAGAQHAKFVPLPDEKRVPRPAEPPGQAWQALSGSGVVRDDGVAGAEWDDDVLDEEHDDFAADADLDDRSEPDFEAEDPSLSVSLDTAETSSVAGSLDALDDAAVASFMARRARHAHAQGLVYSGPLLCREDDDFDD